MPVSSNPHLKQHKIDIPAPLLDAIKAKAATEDENVSSLIRRVMAEYVGWQGQVRNVRDYAPSEVPKAAK